MPILLHFFSSLDTIVMPWSILMFPGHLEWLLYNDFHFNGPIDWGRNYHIQNFEKGDYSMTKKKGSMATVVAVIFMILCFSMASFASTIADVVIGSQTIHFQPKVAYSKLVLRVSSPDGTVYEKIFRSGADPMMGLPGDAVDGSYTYELRMQALTEQVRPEGSDAQSSKLISRESTAKAPVQSGNFLVQGGSIVIPDAANEQVNTPLDVLHYDDVIVTGSICVGFDCVDGESFGYDTLKLKENNLRLYFEDTSTTTFPSGDWRIMINDTTSGGASYFAVQDATNARTVFKIESGAPANSLYVEDYGRIGLGTSVPYVELHIVDGDSPTVRLDQDGSSGWAAQSWDLCGNETNFFLRDVTNGSKLCFRVQPNTPSNTLCLKADGNVGIGTWSPEQALEVERTGEDVQFVLERTDGATAQMTAKENVVNIGSQTNHPVKFMVNQLMALNLKTDGSLLLGNGASCTIGGVWTNASSIELKENVRELTTNDAVDTLKKLNPVRYNYKAEKDEEYLGFIAEEVPDMVATSDRKGMSAMDVVAVLTKVVQQQQETIEELKKLITEADK